MIPRLWYVTDGPRGTAGRDLAAVVTTAARGGLGAVLLREFSALPTPMPGGSKGPALPERALEALLEQLGPARAAGLRVVISRRIDLALGYELDGVQLTADGVPVERARAWLGPKRWIGYSAHSAHDALRARDAGASYVTLSPIFATDSKPGAPALGLDALRATARALDIPVLALGGVTPARSRGILNAGAWGIAAVSALGAASDVEAAARAFLRPLAECTPCIACS